jgi:hypothetical protein
MTAKLAVLFVALALIARVRVAVLPGWVVPLPVLIVAAEFVLCAALVAWTALAAPARVVTVAAPGASGEVA